MHLPHLPSFARTPIVFITTCTERRRPVLANAAAYQVLVDVWTPSATLNDWHVGECMVMPDHVHCFASPGLRAWTLARWMQVWKTAAATKSIGRPARPVPYGRTTILIATCDRAGITSRSGSTCRWTLFGRAWWKIQMIGLFAVWSRIFGRATRGTG